jgi:hypothetical protein
VGHHTEAFVGIDTSKLCNAIAIADGGRGGEVRYFGEFPACGEIPSSDVLLRSRAQQDMVSTDCSRASTMSAWWWR